MIIQICVGSSCHLKGSEEVVELFRSAIETSGYADDIALVGSFCIGKCNRLGVTVQIDDVVHTGVCRENFNDFFNEYVKKVIEKERGGI